VIGLGDADLYRSLLAEFGVEGEARDAVLGRLATHDLVGLEAGARRGRDRRDGDRDLRHALPAARRRRGPRPGARGRRRGGRAHDRPAQGDLRVAGRARHRRAGPDRPRPAANLGYYDGAIFEVYDPAIGHVLGGGGRYDGFLKSFGLDLPAAGFALHIWSASTVAQMEEESRRREKAAG